MNRILKRSLLSLAALLLVLLLLAYAYARYMGMIPRADYDEVHPGIPELQRPAILVLSKTNGFIHHDAIPAAGAMLEVLAQRNGWGLYTTDNAASHSPELLARFDLVVWNNTSGDILTTGQRKALRDWLQGGGSWVGLHAAGGDPAYQWDWYVNTLLGAQFVGHTMDPQFQDAVVLQADGGRELTAHLPTPWRISNEEWYAFDRNPRDSGSEILLTMDESSYITVGETLFGRDNMDGEHPIAWRHALGSGKVFYSAIGHQGATYEIAEYREFIERALRWGLQ